MADIPKLSDSEINEVIKIHPDPAVLSDFKTKGREHRALMKKFRDYLEQELNKQWSVFNSATNYPPNYRGMIVTLDNSTKTYTQYRRTSRSLTGAAPFVHPADDTSREFYSLVGTAGESFLNTIPFYNPNTLYQFGTEPVLVKHVVLLDGENKLRIFTLKDNETNNPSPNDYTLNPSETRPAPGYDVNNPWLDVGYDAGGTGAGGEYYKEGDNITFGNEAGTINDPKTINANTAIGAIPREYFPNINVKKGEIIYGTTGLFRTFSAIYTGSDKQFTEANFVLAVNADPNHWEIEGRGTVVLSSSLGTADQPVYLDFINEIVFNRISGGGNVLLQLDSSFIKRGRCRYIFVQDGSNQGVSFSDDFAGTLPTAPAWTGVVQSSIWDFQHDPYTGKVYWINQTGQSTGGYPGPTVVQSTGQSTTDVMSQKAVTDEFSNSIPTINAVPFNRLCTEISPITITQPETFTVDNTNSRPGYGAILRITADGTNVPVFTGFKKINGSMPYANTAGVLNVVLFWFDGVDYWYSIFQDNAVVPNTGGGGGGENPGGSGVAAPTDGVVDDDANTFTFTPNPLFAISEHEYSLNGAPYATCVSNVITVGNINVAIGALLVRVKAGPNHNASAPLANATAFTVTDPGVVTAHHSTFTGEAMPLVAYVPEIGQPWVYHHGTAGLDGNGVVKAITKNGNVWAIKTDLTGKNYKVTTELVSHIPTGDSSFSIFLRVDIAQLNWLEIAMTPVATALKSTVSNNTTILRNDLPVLSGRITIEVDEDQIILYDTQTTTELITLPQVFEGDTLIIESNSTSDAVAISEVEVTPIV